MAAHSLGCFRPASFHVLAPNLNKPLMSQTVYTKLAHFKVQFWGHFNANVQTAGAMSYDWKYRRLPHLEYGRKFPY